jgi:hypothetical protein
MSYVEGEYELSERHACRLMHDQRIVIEPGKHNEMLRYEAG